MANYKSLCLLIAGLFLSLSASGTLAQSVPSVAELVTGLEQRLQDNPNDMQGWVLLGKSYHHLQNWTKATEAFEQAKKLGYQGSLPPLPNAARAPTKTHPLLRRKEETLELLRPLTNKFANGP
jgi:predicted Zn-dependent protease